MVATSGALLLLVLGGCGNDDKHSPPSPTPAPTATAAPQPTPADVGAPSSIRFSPEVVALDNPTSPGARTAATTFTVEVAAYDADGRRMQPSAEHPLEIELHGVPSGVVTPDRLTLTDGSSATFSYDGSYFAAPITVVAWMAHADADSARVAARTTTGDASAATTSLETTQLVHQNPIDCTYGNESYALPLACTNPDDPVVCAEEAIANRLHVEAAVGFDAPSAESFRSFTVDTGSTGVVVPMNELGSDAIGPGAAGKIFYDSSGRTYAGKYYVASVSLRLADGSFVQTKPIKVLAIHSAYCAEGYPDCEKDPPEPTLHYLGVGFDRTPTDPEDLISRPVDNPFLNLTSASGAGDVSPGYVLGSSTIQLGITSTDGYATIPLSPATDVPGDWQTMPGCFGFPALTGSPQFCGHLLLDVGLRDMFLDLPRDQRPAGVEGATCPGGGNCVPDGVEMEIIAGDPTAPAASYRFTTSAYPVGPAPTYARWLESSNVFVNTGRNALIAYDYLYDARCGNVGFAKKN